MSTFDNIKEKLTNKIDELRDEIQNDSTEQPNEEYSQEQDLRDVPDENTEITHEAPENDLITAETPEDRLATDYDLVQNDLVDQDETNDSGLDDLRDEKIPDEIVNDNEGNLVVDSDVIEVSEYGSDGDLVSEERIEAETVHPLDTAEERRIDEVDELYNSPETAERP